MKSLRTEKEYTKALKRTIAIFHAEEGTPESDELESLLPQVIDYEDRHYPIPEPDTLEKQY
jgi:HTH-type transcriptional regulator/antitoxin HigA